MADNTQKQNTINWNVTKKITRSSPIFWKFTKYENNFYLIWQKMALKLSRLEAN